MYTTETYPVRHIVFHKRMSLEKDSVQPVKSRKYFSNLMLYTILIKGNNLHSKIGQRVQHSASCMLTKSCPKAVVTATMKGCLTLTIFVTLVCRVGANFPCKPEQIHWNTTVGKRPKCFDCPDCLPGSEPSIPCGASVYDWPDIHCVPCKLGKTYSDKYDTSQCKACTICSKGKAVKHNCTLTTNTKCNNKCGPGFYTVRLISSCLPCAQCYGDENDELAAECANNKKKCKVRSTPCTRVHTTPSKPSKRNYRTSNTSPTIQAAVDRLTMTVNEDEKSVSGELSISDISITPTSALDNEVLRNERVESGKQDGISIVTVVILLIIVVALCLVLSVLVIVKKFISVRDVLRSSREQDSNNESYNISLGGTPPLPHSSARSSQDSATPLLNRSESPQPNGSATPQPMVSTSLQTNGAVSSQPNEYESPEPNRSTSLHSSDSVSSQLKGYKSPQPNRSRSAPPQSNESVSSQPSGSASTHSNQFQSTAAQSIRSAQEQDKSNPGDLTLEQLEEKHFEVFEWMCKELNRRRSGERWDFERLASYYKRISLTDRNCLINEFHTERGSPSDLLMNHIKTKYPDYSISDLATNLHSIGRNDLAQRLSLYGVPKSSKALT